MNITVNDNRVVTVHYLPDFFMPYIVVGIHPITVPFQFLFKNRKFFPRRRTVKERVYQVAHKDFCVFFKFKRQNVILVSDEFYAFFRYFVRKAFRFFAIVIYFFKQFFLIFKKSCLVF